MECLFNCCYILKEIKGLDKFNTSKVTNMRGMFQFCFEIKKLDLSNFDISNISNISHMFNKCNKLNEITRIGKSTTGKIISMKSMFQACYELKYLDLTNFNTSNVIDMSTLFN